MNELKFMNRFLPAVTFLAIALSIPGPAQDKPDNSKLDMMLIRGEYKRVIDTCQQILAIDTMNSEAYYRLGLAYQNLLWDDKSFECFLKASALSPDNNNYTLTVAKSHFNRGRTGRAKPLFLKLSAADSMNWVYAYYLTGIYMQEAKYNESIKIYERFIKHDSSNYLYMDKIGFACLRKGDSDRAIDMFNNSLAINPKNINAIKNLAYLYAVSNRVDTAIQLLTRGILLDPEDIDLYARRGALNFSINYNKRALNDYLKILSSGDSSVLYLKRAGIGYTNNLQPKLAIPYLLKAYHKDTSDIEVLRFLAQNYNSVKDFKKSVYYYRHIIDFISPAVFQLGMTYIIMAEVLKSDSLYKEAISAYIKSQEYRSDNSINLNIANLYDEKLKDVPKAIQYYELYLNKRKNSRDMFNTDYVESVRKRVESLKKPKQPAKP